MAAFPSLPFRARAAMKMPGNIPLTSNQYASIALLDRGNIPLSSNRHAFMHLKK